MTTEELQVVVRLHTKLPDEYQVSEAPLTVPGSARRSALSKIVNHLLRLDQTRPFDFLVEGKLLRKSLKDHFIENNLSVENVIEIEYVPVILPPQESKGALHKDWIRSVCCRSNSYLSASYDGTVKRWNEDLDCLWTLSAHDQPITCVTFVPQTHPVMFLTASQDHSIKAWIQDQTKSTPKELAVLTGHSEGVCGIAASPDGSYCCSVGWSEQTNIWPCGGALVEAENDPSLQEKTKRRKTMQPTHAAKTVGPLGQLVGHKGCISGITWPKNNTLFTCAWDHTVKKWDVQTASNVDTFTSSKVIHCLTTDPESSQLIAFGGADSILRLWDTRQTGESISLKLYRSHTNWISSVQWSPSSRFHLATASYDHTVRVWDIRGSSSLGTCSSHKDKVLDVAWSAEWSLLSAGADCKLYLHDLNSTLTVNGNQ